MNPQLSIVIPTRNRREVLLQTLRSLAAQTIPRSPEGMQPYRYEVIVVADGCTDGTVQAVQGLASTEEWRVASSGEGTELIVLEQRWSGASAARNRGMRAARGEVLLLLDDDITAHPNLVNAHLSHHLYQQQAHSTPSVVLGRIIPEKGRGLLHYYLRRSFHNRHLRLQKSVPEFTDLYTGNVSVPTQAALEVGGLDESLNYGEDAELGYRLSKLGLTFIYAPDAIGKHRDLKEAEGLLRDFSRSGQGCVRIYRKWPETRTLLPFSTYNNRSIQMRVVRALLATLGAARWTRGPITTAFQWWAGAPTSLRGRPAHVAFGIARSFYFWLGVQAEVSDREEWARITA
jgi:glycosyltransferase involved in cell wall biosynthesis